MVERNIALFDKLDIEAFTNKDMKTIKEIHSPDVKVYNPDGSLTVGMTPDHERELQWMFDTFPDFEINEHPIAFGSGNWTAGMSISKGTWTAPMKLENGTVIEPTGKPFEIKIATLAKWNNAGQIVEHLFWDSAEWDHQIGLIN